MDFYQKFVCINLLILSNSMKICFYGAPTKGTVIKSELNSNELIKMGRHLNKPLLSLLGATFLKVEQNLKKELSDVYKLKIQLCKQTLCAAWTDWSPCSTDKFNTYGARTRSRSCGGNSTICPAKAAETVETDYQICEGKTCRHTLTNNNYCIKLYNNVRKTQKDAQDDCHKDGGHLINIDSSLKAKDIEDYFKSISFKTTIVWIDGKRTLPNGDWIYEYGSNDTTFPMWGIFEPLSIDDCKVFDIYIGKWAWRGRPCKKTYNYLCEIV